MKAVAHILIVLLFMALPVVVLAQPDRDKVEQLRVAFITKKLEMDNAESQKFWPVYNEYNDKLKALRKNMRMSYRKKTEPLTEAEAEELYQLEQKTRQAELDVHKLYSEKLKAIIGVRKFVRLRAAEEEFKRDMINSLKDRSD